MNDLIQLTSRQAAHLLKVHESSIKRWCKDGDLNCSVTDGGHRRITLNDLTDFARSRSLDCALLEFDSHASAIWHAFRLAQSKGEYSALLDLSYSFLKASDSWKAFALFDFCMENGIPFSMFFDRLVADILNRVGNDWHNGRLEIGEEHRITELLRDAVYRQLCTSDENLNGQTAIVGSSEGNMHELGALAVRTLLQNNGWHVVYVGANVPTHNYASLQARYKASLVCISIVPPSVLSDVHRILDTLARFYDESKPYHIALGGNTVSRHTDVDFSRAPFLGVQQQTSLESFETWLNSVNPSTISSSSL